MLDKVFEIVSKISIFVFGGFLFTSILNALERINNSDRL